MLRITLATAVLFCLCQTGIAQHSFTGSLAGTGVFSAGGQLKYTYNSYRAQLAPYVSFGVLTHLGDQLFTDDFPDNAGLPLMNIYGVCINSKPDFQKDVSSYFGVAAEYMSVKAKGAKELRKLLLGCQYGVNARLAKHTYLNADMGIRTGINRYEEMSRSPGGAERITKRTSPLVYLPVSVGISYVFGEPPAK